MRTKRWLSFILVFAVVLNIAIPPLELNADIIDKYVVEGKNIKVIKTGIIADGVFNSEGYASLTKYDGKEYESHYALADQNGNLVFDYDKFFQKFYLNKGTFVNSTAPDAELLKSGKGLSNFMFDFKGNKVSDRHYPRAEKVTEDYYLSSIEDEKAPYGRRRTVVDRNGNVVLEFPYAMNAIAGASIYGLGYTSSAGGFSEGLMWIGPRILFGKTIFDIEAESGYFGYGYCDFKGNMVIPSQFSKVTPFKEGLAAVSKRNEVTDKEEAGFINKKGEAVIAFIYDGTEPFYDGYAVIRKNEKKGYINKKGDMVVPTIYDQAFGHGNGLCSVGVKSGKKQDRFGNDTDAFKYGFCDTQGNMVVPMEFDDVSIFENGVAYAIKDRTLYILKAHERPEYVYDEADKGEGLVLPTDELANVTDKATAAEAVTKAIAGATEEQKASATGTDLLTLYGEEVALRTAKTEVEGSEFIIDKASVEKVENTALEGKTAVEGALKEGGVTIQRSINSGVLFEFKDSEKLSVKVDASSAEAKADNVRVETPTYALSFNKKALASIKEESAEPLEITVTELPSENVALRRLMGTQISSKAVGANILEDAVSKVFDIKFSKKIKEKIKLSLPVIKGNPNYQAVYDSTGKAIGGKYNPVTKKLDVKINKSDKYVVKEKKKSFADITSKSKEMQDAIEILASKGIIAGTSPTNFSPDGTITRAEIAALILRSISKLNPSENGGFSDVASTDWYFGAVGSAKRNGIMNGVSKTVFAPKKSILKDQIVAVAARVLKEEMGYLAPAGPEAFLGSYTDAAAIPNWAKSDVALATREGLVVKRYDSAFIPAGTMTRGDVAVILHRLFKKLW